MNPTVIEVVFGALVIAKAILIVDVTPAVRRFRDKALVLHVLWKSVVYLALIMVFRYLEELIPLWSKYDSFVVANRSLGDEVSWPHFWILQLWLVVSVLAYSIIVTLDEHFGAGSIRKALFANRRDSRDSGPD